MDFLRRKLSVAVQAKTVRVATKLVAAAAVMTLSGTVAKSVLSMPKQANGRSAASNVVAMAAELPVKVVKKAAELSHARHMMTGLASWYGKVWQGRPTADGGVFDAEELTAAHRTLPFGTLVKVTDLRNHRTVVVRITDRGALNADRVIDLSYAAADELGMVDAGVHPVSLEVLARHANKNSSDTAALAVALPAS